MKDYARKIQEIAKSKTQEIAIILDSERSIERLIKEFSWEGVFKIGRNHVVFDNGSYVTFFAKGQVNDKMCGVRFNIILTDFNPSEKDLGIIVPMLCVDFLNGIKPYWKQL